MGQHHNWIELGIVYVLLFGLQFITRIKAVSDGMVVRQLMLDHKMKANKVIEKIKEQAKEAKRKDELN